MAISYNESSDYYVISDAAGLTLPNDDWCVGIWTRVDENGGDYHQYLVSNNWPSSSPYLYIALKETENTPEEDNWQGGVSDGSSSDFFRGSSAPGPDSVDRLVVVQRDATANEFQLWLCAANGTAVKDASQSDAGYGAMNCGDWNIGRRVDGDPNRYYGSIASEFFKGDFKLTQGEIETMAAGQNIFGIGKSPDVYLSMLAADPTLYDLSGNGNNATRTSTPVTVSHPLNLYNLRRRRL